MTRIYVLTHQTSKEDLWVLGYYSNLDKAMTMANLAAEREGGMEWRVSDWRQGHDENGNLAGEWIGRTGYESRNYFISSYPVDEDLDAFYKSFGVPLTRDVREDIRENLQQRIREAFSSQGRAGEVLMEMPVCRPYARHD
jgi:hypothetical protein